MHGPSVNSPAAITSRVSQSQMRIMTRRDSAQSHPLDLLRIMPAERIGNSPRYAERREPASHTIHPGSAQTHPRWLLINLIVSLRLSRKVKIESAAC
ncbi:hypothetical protein Sinac_2898 [Singulisphaera acidiphila DSM 18658]|uniref:Uncharacterized protein n=1 Tax=Singulisphaera acidiphila (strain ATCC BAA-1392 / DSM 18658 / VKM B-2454 / MOB10) TaxID=886293 RepID=L0DEA0_SINAD|nr:hypothetical protein Sinac_2898 [Singulisphaera acidiphila DSM 18658]